MPAVEPRLAGAGGHGAGRRRSDPVAENLANPTSNTLNAGVRQNHATGFVSGNDNSFAPPREVGRSRRGPETKNKPLPKEQGFVGEFVAAKRREQIRREGTHYVVKRTAMMDRYKVRAKIAEFQLTPVFQRTISSRSVRYTRRSVLLSVADFCPKV